MKHEKKFSQEEQQISETQSRQTTASEFASPEELLRFDAKQTPLPRTIAERLRRSLQNESAPPRSWWQKWFGRQ
jgi:hypothetical protein